MASQTISLGAIPFGGNRTWEGAILLDTALINGGGTAYIRFIRLASNGRIRVRTSITAGGDPSVEGPRFTTAVENYASAFTFTEVGGSSITIEGPTNVDTITPDSSEPYNWQPATNFNDWYIGTSSGVITVTISDGAGSSVATLSALGVTGQSLSPAFASGTYDYSVDVINSVSSVTITATPTDSNASVAGTGAHALSVGSNEVTVTITAENGTSTQDYVIDVMRAAAPTPTNQPPTVVIHTPSQAVDGGDSISLSATLSDADGTIALSIWSGLGIFDDDSAEDTDWTAPTAGSVDSDYVLTLTATDDDGATASASITITVNAAAAIVVHFDSYRILVAGADITRNVVEDTVSSRDVIESRGDTMDFEVRIDSGEINKPEGGNIVKWFNGSTVEFEGVISSVTPYRVQPPEDNLGDVWSYICHAIDYTFLLDRILVKKVYSSQAADITVRAIVSNFTSGFTTVNIDSGAPILSELTFDYVAPSDAITQIARASGWQWWVDFDRSVNFHVDNFFQLLLYRT